MTVGKLLDHGADVTAADSNGCTALHKVAYWNMFSAVDPLVGARADLPAPDVNGRMPFHPAAEALAILPAHALFTHGAMFNVPDKLGLSRLHMAAIVSKDGSSAETVNCLLTWGADEKAVDDHPGKVDRSHCTTGKFCLGRPVHRRVRATSAGQGPRGQGMAPPQLPLDVARLNWAQPKLPERADGASRQAYGMSS